MVATPGSLTISAPNGDFSLSGSLFGKGGAGGTNGSFSADFSPNGSRSTPTFDISAIDSILNSGANNTGGFTESRVYRLRTGDVQVTGTANALNYSLSADAGSIEVKANGLVDASGPSNGSLTGGSISLVANGNVTLDAGAKLTVAATDFNDAGQGGSVTLEAGSGYQRRPQS